MNKQSIIYNGIGAAAGIGIGCAIVVKETDISYARKEIAEDMRQAEKQRYEKCVETFIQDTNELIEQLKKTAGDKESEILDGQLSMISDPMVANEVDNAISMGQCAEEAFDTVCQTFIAMFGQIDDEMMSQRVNDIKDLRVRILKLLLDKPDVDLSKVAPNTIIIAKELTPSMTAGINRANVCGIVTENGGRTSHIAILSRAMSIPSVLSVPDIANLLDNGDSIIVDGTSGNVIVNPKQSEIDEYAAKKKAYEEYITSLNMMRGKRLKKADGSPLEVYGNIGNATDAGNVIDNDGEGVGLFRTEFLFMDKNKAPNENEQFEAYKDVAKKLNGRPVIIRTLDAGGDKDIPYLELPREENPFLGYRAIRICLDKKELYLTQLRALVRASAFGDIRIMVPMVTCVSELLEVKQMVKDICDEFEQDGIAYNKNLQIGVMIETPAACVMADELAKEAAFFSIGTNDLTQYIMAADRGNAHVANLYSAFNPAVLRCIEHIIKTGKNAGISVGMCGEAASNPAMIEKLVEWGLDEYSVNPSSILETRNNIQKCL